MRRLKYAKLLIIYRPLRIRLSCRRSLCRPRLSLSSPTHPLHVTVIPPLSHRSADSPYSHTILIRLVYTAYPHAILPPILMTTYARLLATHVAMWWSLSAYAHYMLLRVVPHWLPVLLATSPTCSPLLYALDHLLSPRTCFESYRFLLSAIRLALYTDFSHIVWVPRYTSNGNH